MNRIGTTHRLNRRLTLEHLEGRRMLTSVGTATLDAPYHNAASAYDVNADQFISPIDALLVINRINSTGSGPLPAQNNSAKPAYIDVNGDAYLTPLDVLMVINQLNAYGSGPVEATPEGGEGEHSFVGIPQDHSPSVDRSDPLSVESLTTSALGATPSSRLTSLPGSETALTSTSYSTTSRHGAAGDSEETLVSLGLVTELESILDNII